MGTVWLRDLAEPRGRPILPATVETPQAPPLTIGDLLAVLWRRRWLAAAAAAVVAGLVLVALLRQTPLFEAEAALAVDRGRKAVRFDEMRDEGRIEFSLLNTQRDLLLSRQVMADAVVRGGVADQDPFASVADPGQVLESRIRVTTSRDSWVIQVALRDEDGQRAERLLGAVLAAFDAAQNRQQAARSQGALTFLGQQVANARDRLEAARTAEARFRDERGIALADPEDNLYTSMLQRLNEARVGVEKDLAEVTAFVAMGQGATGPSLVLVPTVGSDALVIEARKTLLGLADRAVELATKYKGMHPRMREIAAQMEAAQVEVGRAAEIAWSRLVGEQRARGMQRDMLVARAVEIERQLSAYRADLARLEALSQESRSRERLLEQLLTRLAEEEVASRLEAGQVTVVDPPRAGVRPVNIKKSLFAAAALLAGIAAGLGMALLAEALDRRIRGASTAAGLARLPVVGHVPQVPGLEPLGAGGNPDQPPVLADAVRVLRSALRVPAEGKPGRVLVLTSSAAGEGKTTLSTRLAISLASAGVRTLLVDADLRRPAVARHLGLAEDAAGLAEALVGGTATPIASGHPRLEVLTAGVDRRNPGERLSGTRMADLLAGWRNEYAAVIIDTSPLGAVADGLAACALADGVLLVVRDRLVTRAALARSLDRLKPLGDRVLGLIVNGEQATDQGGYGYGYGEGGDGVPARPAAGIATATRKFLRLKPGGDKPA